MRLADGYTGIGVGVALAAIVGGTLLTAPGSEVGLGSGRLREGMTEEEIEQHFGTRAEHPMEGFAFSSSGCPPMGGGAWRRSEHLVRCRGPLTTVDGTLVYDTREPARGLENLRVRPTVLALPEPWYYGAAVLALGVTFGLRSLRRRVPAPASSAG